MDKKVIKALSNFGEAIDTLVEELKKQSEDKKEKKSIFSNIFGKKSLSKQIKSIQEGIKDIKKDTKEIITNQKDLKKLLESDKKDKGSGVFSETGDDKNKNKIKEGVGSIILIAGAVLAIGTAFSLLDPKKLDIPLILALSFAITMLGLTLAKLKEAGVPSAGESLAIGLAMTIFAGSVVASAALMTYIPEIKTNQFLTFLGVAATFALMFQLGMDDMVKATRRLKPKQVLYLPLIMVGISAAIVGASYILQYTQPIDFSTLKSVFLTGVTLGALALVMSIPLLIISKLGKSMLKGAILSIALFPAMILSIALSSYLLNTVETIDFNKMGGIIATSLAIGAVSLIMTIPMVVLGLLASSGVGLVVLGLGALAIPIVVGAMALSSHILAMGNYKGGPSLEWAKAVSLSLLAFVPSMIAMGGMLALPIVGAVIMSGGKDAILDIMDVIQKSSHILNKGHYTGGPPVEWAEGVSLALGAFSPIYKTLLANGDMSLLGGGGIGPEDFTNAITTVSAGILAVATVFANNKAVWSGYPTKEWSEGVGLAISAFAPVYKNLNSSIGGSILNTIFGKGDTSTKMKNAMVSIAEGIVDVNAILSKEDFKSGNIDPKWAKSASSLISGFSKAYAHIIDSDLSTEDIELATPILMKIAKNIAPISKLLGGLNEINAMDVDLVKLSDGVLSMAEAIDELSNSLENLSETKVSNLYSLTKSLLGMSVVNPDNLTETLDKLSKKEKEIKKIVSSVKSEGGMGLDSFFTEIKNVLPELNIASEDKPFSSLEDKVNEMVNLLQMILNSNTNISDNLRNLKKDDDMPKLDFL